MGFFVAQEGHVVNIAPPIDLNDAAKTCDAFSMANYDHASIIIQLGVTGAASTVTVEECTSAAGAGATAIAFNYYAETTDSGDTLSAVTAATSAGFDTSANDNVFYVIELDAADLSDGSPWVRVQFSDPGAATLGSAVAILSGGRYQNDQNATAIA